MSSSPEDVQTTNVRKVLTFDRSYEYAVLDLPPALTKLTEKVITLSDSVFIPIELGTFAIQGIPAVTGALANCNAKFGGCIVNKFDKENPADTELLEFLKCTLGKQGAEHYHSFQPCYQKLFQLQTDRKGIHEMDGCGAGIRRFGGGNH